MIKGDAGISLKHISLTNEQPASTLSGRAHINLHINNKLGKYHEKQH